jgi:hypothetical protein
VTETLLLLINPKAGTAVVDPHSNLDQVLGSVTGYNLVPAALDQVRYASPDSVVISSPGQACLVPALTPSSGPGKRTCSLVTWSYLQNSLYPLEP